MCVGPRVGHTYRCRCDIGVTQAKLEELASKSQEIYEKKSAKSD